MLDRSRILEKIDDVERYVRELGDVRPASVDEYMEDVTTRYACERLLQVVIEALADIGELFVIGERLGLPRDEAGMADRLVEGGILDQADAELLRRMHGFRNVLVHRYGRLDDDKVFENAQKADQDALRLARRFRAALDERGSR